MAIPKLIKHAALIALLVIPFINAKAQIGFGTTTPDPSAIVHIQDTAKGLLIPRMTTAQKNNIPNPAKGLMIFQTDSTEGFYYYTGTQWVSFANNYKQTLILTGDITNSEAAAKIAREVGPQTQEISIYDCSALTSVDLSMLTNIAAITINNNPVLQSVDLSNLKSVDAAFTIYLCPALTSFNMPLLETVGRNLRFSLTGMATLNFPVLKKVVTGVEIEENPSLVSVSFPQFTGPSSRVLPSFNINGNDELVSIAAPVLGRVESMHLNYNKKCTLINFSALSSAKTLQLGGDSALASLSFPSLASLSGMLALQGDSSLTSISFPVLTTAESISISDIISTTFSLPALNNMGNLLLIQNCKNLTTISLPALATIAGTLNIGNNSLLASLNAPVLTSIGTILFSSNNSYGSLNFPVLTTLASPGGQVTISGSNLTSISFPSLTIAKCRLFDFTYNKLPSASVNALLNKFTNIVPAITWTEFRFEHQIPPAPPTGQGITDRATLWSGNNNVITD